MHLPSIARYAQPCAFPERILQFGTGALLRGLPDAIIDRANAAGRFNGSIVTVASTASGRGDVFADQAGLFTHYVEGIADGQPVHEVWINRSLSRSLQAATDWPAVMALAADPGIGIILSNTTEVGLRYAPDDLQAHPPATFPGKLTAFLYQRYHLLPDHPPVILPCELLVDNGTLLRDLVLRHAADHDLGPDFATWVATSVAFCNTLVDRIVTGTPAPARKAAIEAQLGYADDLLTVAEPYGLWAIEGGTAIEARLGFAFGDPHAFVVPDITPYRERKLRILNGSHTFLVGAGILAGKRTVKDCLDDPGLAAFLQGLIFDEIVPSLPPGVADGAKFAAAVLDRFRNPSLDHQLLDIALQYTSKMAMRNVASIVRYIETHGAAPQHMARGFAAYLHFCRPRRQEGARYCDSLPGRDYPLNDAYAAWWDAQWQQFDPQRAGDWLAQVLRQSDVWGVDLDALPGWRQAVLAPFVQELEQISLSSAS
ncbi:MAG: tagaturonate reductase [Bacteroidia bacterium]